MDKIKTLMPGWVKEGVSGFVITGSDPLNNGSLTDLANYCTGKKFRVTIQTTGENLVESGVLENLKRHEKILFEVPLYGATPEEHDGVTGISGSFRKVLEIIENQDLNVEVHTVPIRSNIERIEAIKKICDDRGRILNLLVLYMSYNEAIYTENAPRLTRVIEVAREIFTPERFTRFALVNRGKIPPCLVSTGPLVKKDYYTQQSLEGFDVKSQIWDARNPNMIECRHKKECASAKTCPGVYGAYVRIYGWEEFVPV